MAQRTTTPSKDSELICCCFLIHFADSPIFKSRRLLSEVAWEKCDLEIEHARNYTDRDSWHAPNIAYVWLALYIFCVLVIFLGN